MQTQDVRVFTYGSDMDSGNMRQVCPSANVVGPARIPNARVCFQGWNKDLGTYLAHFLEREGHSLWGVVWRISKDELTSLDRYEETLGYNRGRIEIHNAENGPDTLQLYLLSKGQPGLRGLPSHDYLSAMVAGAEEHHLPRDYIQALRQTVRLSDKFPVPDKPFERIWPFLPYCLEHPIIAGAGLYFYVSTIGLIYNLVYLKDTGINLTSYYETEDFLLGGLRHPTVLLTLTSLMLFLTLVAVAVFFVRVVLIKALNLKYTRIVLGILVSILGSKFDRLFRRIATVIGTGKLTYLNAVFIVFVSIAFSLFMAVYAISISRDCNETIKVEYKKEPTNSVKPVEPPETSGGRLLGSTSQFIFLSSDTDSPGSSQIIRREEVKRIISTPAPGYNWVCLLLR
jgi:gamma-glutamylcyclotransferase (GGCT)/AIG2-like uncharacterized protein YtfP